MLKKIKQHLSKKINIVLGEKIINSDNFEYPPQSKMGDLAIPCFEIAKTKKKSPVIIATELKNKIETDKFIEKIITQGAYINFFIKKEYLIKNIIANIKKNGVNYGINNSGSGKKVMIEFSNVNTHKEYHVGHLRNICYGNAISKILSANGYNVIPVSYVNDFGIHTAKTLWNYKDFLREHYTNIDIDKMNASEKGFILGKMYVDASQKSKDNPEAKEEINNFMKKIETRNGEKYELWKKTRNWSIEQFKNIYKDLNIKFVEYFYESNFIDKGLEDVKGLLQKGTLEKSDGAVIANLEDNNLGVLVFLRSNGTATYPVADLALAKEKIEKYNLSKSIYVVDNRQTLYFKQLFKVLENIGHKNEMIHLPYEFVKLKNGMMSSRSGNVITYKELKEEIEKTCKKEIEKRHTDWNKKKIEKISKKIGLSAIKFEMNKVNPDSIITFDIKKALNYEGFTSAYIQYAYVRIQSILKKANVTEIKNADLSKLKEEKEYNLVLKLAKYLDVVRFAGDKYNPSIITKYLFELAQQFNEYYHGFPVLKADNDLMMARICLLDSIRKVLENGLGLLGIDCLEEM